MSKEITIKDEVSSLVGGINDLVIASPEQMAEATKTLSKINKIRDNIKEEKEKLTKPINEALKEIRLRYKPAEDLLDFTVTELKKKMGSYQTLALKEQSEQVQKIADKVSNGKLKATTAIKKLSELDSVEQKIKTDEGSISFRTDIKWEVTDILALANFDKGLYVEPDHTAIKEALKNGIELPGVKSWTEQNIINRRK